MEETGRKCERPTQQGVLTVLDTWSNGLMGMLSTSVTGNLSDWKMVIEWNKPVSSNAIGILVTIFAIFVISGHNR